MKKRIPYVMLLLALLGVASEASAAGTELIQSTGLSDEALFVILAVIAIFQLVGIMVIAGVIKSVAQYGQAVHGKWKKAATLLAILLTTASTPALAQESSFEKIVVLDDTGFILLVSLNLFLFIAFMYLVVKLNGLFSALTEGTQYAKVKRPWYSFSRAKKAITGAQPVENEEELMTDHVYDGIRELDNSLPTWWVWGFYAGIVFAVVYMLHYHVFKTGDLMIAEYENELVEAEASKAEFVAENEDIVDENNVTVLEDAARVASGEKIYKLNCAACHGQAGEGGVGPNLADDYWLHGGDVKSVFHTIKYGVPEKGMVSWKATLSAGQMQEVTSFILTLRGTNPPNAKEPQGELFTDDITAIAQ